MQRQCDAAVVCDEVSCFSLVHQSVQSGCADLEHEDFLFFDALSRPEPLLQVGAERLVADNIGLEGPESFDFVAWRTALTEEEGQVGEGAFTGRQRLPDRLVWHSRSQVEA